MYDHKQVIIKNAIYRTQERDREQRMALQRLDTLADIPENKIPEYKPIKSEFYKNKLTTFFKQAVYALRP
jgi:hypothetical protein